MRRTVPWRTPGGNDTSPIKPNDRQTQSQQRGHARRTVARINLGHELLDRHSPVCPVRRKQGMQVAAVRHPIRAGRLIRGMCSVVSLMVRESNGLP
jgi:hypothetical protein